MDCSYFVSGKRKKFLRLAEVCTQTAGKFCGKRKNAGETSRFFGLARNLLYKKGKQDLMLNDYKTRGNQIMSAFTKSQEIISQTSHYGANNYHPLPIVISEAQGVWVKDPEGNQYMDMLSAYSAVNQGHRHPKIIQALKDQADKITLTSRAFHNDQLGPFYEKTAKLTGKDMILPMNTGAEAVESAVKAARRWAYEVKGVADNQAEIIACIGNFHGRTMLAVSLSSEDEYKRGFGPMLPGIKLIPYGDAEALRRAITPNTAAFLFEPIQGEAGIVIPPEGFLQEAAAICKEENVLLIADEIQTGLGRTGKTFAVDWENIVPDMFILGKALGGGVFPISCIAANRDILGVFNPGSHGSTFGGNPLACAVSLASLEVLEEEGLAERSLQLGRYFKEELEKIDNPIIKDVRGRGLFIGVELTEAARPYCEKLKGEGLLCKETHDTVIRFAPPLMISKEDLDWAIQKITNVLQNA
ncbi:Ornithine aminotransferase [Bacillus velezensis]|nr:Ornithine aminotransferase [Bacillus velezensis]QHK12714.1 Ornithine aminotransferase [Bacillus velezensis]QHK13518.1 Ornithine aminotransferase [Bacillus velezensis]QHK63465.1 Ornithine aminotransferase [Bacillus velezensis]QHL92134.1 Ornithine aminotransferase [Bacillus velezensis]